MPKTKHEQLLNRYYGTLTASEVANGMNAAIGNACRLASDAKILLDAERYPSAASVAALSIEESGKVTILRRLSIARNSEEAKIIWKEYRNHRAKNTMWILPELASKGARNLVHFGDAVDKYGEHT